MLPSSSQAVQRGGDIGGCELSPTDFSFGLNIAGSRRMHNGDVDPFVSPVMDSLALIFLTLEEKKNKKIVLAAWAAFLTSFSTTMGSVY